MQEQEANPSLLIEIVKQRGFQHGMMGSGSMLMDIEGMHRLGAQYMQQVGAAGAGSAQSQAQ